MIYYEDYLAHHGIPGQKWGVRRYQRKDGTLTRLGRKRLGLSPKREKSSTPFSKINRGETRGKVSTQIKKASGKMDNAETAVLKEYLRAHPDKLYKNRNRLSKEDIDELVSQINWDRKVADVSRAARDRRMDKIRRVGTAANTAYTTANNLLKAYNLTADIYNTYSGANDLGWKEMPNFRPDEYMRAKRDEEERQRKDEEEKKKKS